MQSVRNVPGDYPTIQQAIDAAIDGDTVLVAPGTYFEHLDLGSKRISLRSSGGPAVTTVDAGYAAPVVSIGSGATRATLVEGFTLTHGKDAFDAGGVRIQSGSPTIRGNTITANRGGEGNGISMSYSSALIEANRITNNVNSGDLTGGGGGGGIYIGGNPCGNPPVDCGAEIRGNLIQGNTVTRFTEGGGIDVFAGGPVRIIGNEIRANSAPGNGGGIVFYNSADAQVENNLIVDNVLTAQNSQGGGIYWLVPYGRRGPYVVNNTIINNMADHGAGVYADGYDGAAHIANNVVVAPTGRSGIECGTSNDPLPPVVRYNDVVANLAAAYAGLCAGLAGTQGNVSVAPTFVAANDYRLAPGAAGIDAGNNADSTEAFDLLGIARVVDGDGDGSARVDMGAFETLVATTTLSLATSGTPAALDATVTFTAVIGNSAGAGGNVTFCADATTPGSTCQGGTVLCTIAATTPSLQCATSDLSVGTHAITAIYSGDATHAGSVSPVLAQRIGYASTTTLARSVSTGTRFTVSLVAAVIARSPSGTIVFMDGGVPVSTCASVTLVESKARCLAKLESGKHTLTAVYGGDASNLASVSDPLVVNVR